MGSPTQNQEMPGKPALEDRSPPVPSRSLQSIWTWWWEVQVGLTFPGPEVQGSMAHRLDREGYPEPHMGLMWSGGPGDLGEAPGG